MRVMGIVGWSGAGKTTLLVRLIPELRRRGLVVSTLKHAHHGFDMDRPGKDSFEHRRAGAREVIVASQRRWAQLHELAEGEQAGLAELLPRLSPCDLVLAEGFKSSAHPKLEVFRAGLGKPPLHPHDPRIVALACDPVMPEAIVPTVALDDIAGVARLVCSAAEPVAEVRRALARDGRAAQ